MINIHKKNLILSYKRLYSNRVYSINDALCLFKKLLFLNPFGIVDISIKMSSNKKIIFNFELNSEKKIIKSDKFGLINLNIGSIDDVKIKENILNLINSLKYFISQNSLKSHIHSISLSFNMIFGIFININS